MRFWLSLMFLFPFSVVADESTELVQFENGEVANADDINANFENLNQRLTSVEGSTPSSSSSGCVEEDLVGNWLHDEIPSIDSASVRAYDWKFKAGNDLEVNVYSWTPESGYVDDYSFTGTWQINSTNGCELGISIDTSLPNNLGVAWVAPSKSVMTLANCPYQQTCQTRILTKFWTIASPEKSKLLSSSRAGR